MLHTLYVLQRAVRLSEHLQWRSSVWYSDLRRSLPQRCQLWHVRLGFILQRQHMPDLPHDLLRRQDLRHRDWDQWLSQYQLRQLLHTLDVLQRAVRVSEHLQWRSPVWYSDLRRSLPQRCQLRHVRLGLILQRQHLSDLPHDLLRRQDLRHRDWDQWLSQYQLRKLLHTLDVLQRAVRLPEHLQWRSPVWYSNLWRSLPQRCQLWHVRLGLILQRKHMPDLPHDLLRRQDVRHRDRDQWLSQYQLRQLSGRAELREQFLPGFLSHPV